MCSCFGTVLSLNGEPEPSVYVEAVTLETSPPTCRRLQEESQTEVDGSFRIRGLQVNTITVIIFNSNSTIKFGRSINVHCVQKKSNAFVFFLTFFVVFMATLCNRAGHYIFALWFLLLSIFLLSFFFFVA